MFAVYIMFIKLPLFVRIMKLIRLFDSDLITVVVRSFSSCLTLFLIAFIPTACAMEKDMILELKDIQFFQAQQANSPPEKIKLSGLVFHSSLAIREITTSVQVDSLQVIVHLTPATANLSGNLDYTITVPELVNAVTFGNENVVIWNRNTGITHRK